MYEFIIHDDTVGDLERLAATDSPAFYELVALFEQLEDDQDLLDRLTQKDYGGWPSRPTPRTALFNVNTWGAAQAKNLNLWRMRGFESSCAKYRCIYAFFPTPGTYIVLGVGIKTDIANTMDEFDYETDSPLSKRIIEAYNRLVEEDF